MDLQDVAQRERLTEWHYGIAVGTDLALAGALGFYVWRGEIPILLFLLAAVGIISLIAMRRMTGGELLPPTGLLIGAGLSVVLLGVSTLMRPGIMPIFGLIVAYNHGRQVRELIRRRRDRKELDDRQE